MTKRTQEEIRIDLGMQCPECFGVPTEELAEIAAAARQQAKRFMHFVAVRVS